MRVLYAGRQAYGSDGQKAKVQRESGKINRALARDGHLDARMDLSRGRHDCEPEVTLRELYQTLVVTGHNAQAFAAVHIGVDKLERQAAKNKCKLVNVRRPPRQRDEPEVQARGAIAAENAPVPEPEPKGRRRTQNEASKPLRREGAQMALESGTRANGPTATQNPGISA